MTEAYKIGITVAMTNLVSAELGRIGQSLMGVHNQAKGLELTLGTIARIGVAAGFVATIAAIAEGVDEARKFQIEATKFASLGFGDAVNTQARRFAEGMDTLGTSATQNMALVSDAMAVFKDLGHAEIAAPLMAKMKFANSAIYGADGGEHDRKFMDMLKVIEFRGGLSSDKEFNTQADYVQKVINGSRNRVDATQLLSALKTGGVALSQMSNESFYLGSEPLIQEFGGLRFGTGMMSAYQNLVMARGALNSQAELFRLGLLDPKKVQLNAITGQVKKALPGSFTGSDILEHDGALALIEKVLLPAFAKKGITSDDAIIQEIGRIFSNRTASSLFSRIYQQRTILHKQMDANKNAMGIDALTNAADATLDGKVIELQTQWRDILKNLGTEVLPLAIDGLKGLTWILRGLNWIFGSQNAAKQLAHDQGRDTLAGAFNDPLGMGWNLGALFTHNWSGDAHKFMQGVQNKDGWTPKSSGDLTTVINLDGKHLATTVSKYQVDGVAGFAPSSPTGFDGRMSLAGVN